MSQTWTAHAKTAIMNDHFDGWVDEKCNQLPTVNNSVILWSVNSK